MPDDPIAIAQRIIADQPTGEHGTWEWVHLPKSNEVIVAEAYLALVTETKTREAKHG